MRSPLLGLFGALTAFTLCLTPADAQEKAPPATDKAAPAKDKAPPAKDKKAPGKDEKAPVDDGLTAPEAGSPEAALLDGLRLIADGKFDQWIERYCHTEKLCRSPQATKSIKRYNLTAANRLVPFCLKGEKRDKLKITKQAAKGDELKLFLGCHGGAMPRPFTMVREAGAWKFRRI